VPGVPTRRVAVSRGREVKRLMFAGLTVAAVAAVAAIGIVGTVGLGGGGSTTASAGTQPPATATVTRGTLTETEDVPGTLGYGDPTVLSGRLPGTITELPTPGHTVKHGEALYRVNASPVVLLYGTQPMYRTLAPGVEGADVAQFERELSALGYQGFTVDDAYTSATADAVRRWQEALGLTETGTVETGRIVFAPAAVRVGAVSARLGDAATGPVLSYTGTSRQVTVKLDVAKQDLARAGAPATVRLPNGATVAGTVGSVGTVATAGAASGGQTAPTTIDVAITVAEQAKLGTYDEAPVEVTLIADERKDVLIVPVAALLALAEGGYGVQVVSGSQTRIVAVTTGLFAGGKVEISGEGIDVGTIVGMPS
jgi:peptidoglycan hydrolase-like protein with peptidoglycan-binding domain